MNKKSDKKTPEFVNFHPIKNYIRDEVKIKSADDAVNILTRRFNEVIVKAINDAAIFARRKRRKTIMPRDMERSIEENLGMLDPTPEELLKEILKHNPTDLAHIAEGIGRHRKGMK
ncbi:MAG: hypothetical protein U9R36_01075 [Elusimicrobiota bacterium]|nr:hypothetical protein [Elusimicrobiota bacterium]